MLQLGRWSLALALIIIHQSLCAQIPGPVDPGKLPAHQEVVVVTGTFAPLPASDVDRPVTFIELDSRDHLYKSWVDSLATEPSIDFRQRGPDDIQGDVSIRGSSFGETLILVNGMRMDDVQSAHHDADLPLPIHAIERIEVLKGAGSALYGSDAMAGSLNVITATPERSDLSLGAASVTLASTSNTARLLSSGRNSMRRSMLSAIFRVAFVRIATTAAPHFSLPREPKPLSAVRS